MEMGWKSERNTAASSLHVFEHAPDRERLISDLRVVTRLTLRQWAGLAGSFRVADFPRHNAQRAPGTPPMCGGRACALNDRIREPASKPRHNRTHYGAGHFDQRNRHEIHLQEGRSDHG